VACWPEIASFVRTTVKKHLRAKERWDPESLRNTCLCAAKLTAFHYERTSQLSERTVFCHDTVVQFGIAQEAVVKHQAAQAPSEQREALMTKGLSSIATEESRLITLGRSINPHGAWPKQSDPRPRLVTPPYTAEEVAQLEADVAANSGLAARHGEAFLVLGLGAGLDGRELRTLGPEHCHDLGAAGVYIEANGRRVPVLAQYEDRLRALIVSTPEGAPLIGGNAHYCNAVNEARRRVITSADGPALNLGRLRNTWLLTHLAMGTRVKELLKAAGLMGLNPVSDLARFLPELDNADAQVELRGASGAR
jgi:hypothetical protein